MLIVGNGRCRWRQWVFGDDETVDLVHRVWQVLKETGQAVVNFQGRRRALVRRYLFPLLKRVTPSVAVERDGVWYFVATADRVIGRDVYAYGSYDEYVMVETLRILERHAGRPNALLGRTFVDIGANIGTSTVAAFKHFGASRAIAFEPSPRNLKMLRSNLVMNDLQDRVMVFPLALSNANGTATLELAEHNWGDHRVRSRLHAQEGMREAPRRGIDIQLARFDDVMTDISTDLPPLGLVWIDTQGFEGHVLSGACSLLESDVPVVIEYDPRYLRHAGGLAILQEVISESYREVVDLRSSASAGRIITYPANRVPDLQEVYKGRAFTDLLLLK